MNQLLDGFGVPELDPSRGRYQSGSKITANCGWL